MTPTEPAPYKLSVTPTVRRQLAESLPEPVAFAAYEFVTGPLLEAPGRLGKRLPAPFEGRLSARRGTYRVIYRIDEDTHSVTVLQIRHRREAYRSP